MRSTRRDDVAQRVDVETGVDLVEDRELRLRAPRAAPSRRASARRRRTRRSRRGRGARRGTPSAVASATTASCRPARVDVAGAHRSARRASRAARPGTSTGYCIARNRPALRALPGGQADELFAVDRDRAAGDLVVGAAHERVRRASTSPSRSGPSSACTSPERTSRSTPRRISLPATLDAQVRDAQHVIAHGTTTFTSSPST